MAHLVIHRGTHQIGGCCTEFALEDRSVYIDFGSNLPGCDADAEISDKKMVENTIGHVAEGGKEIKAVLFSHYHGDHYGLYKELDIKTPIYMGKIAKEILKVVTHYIDKGTDVKGIDRIEKMNTYVPGKTFYPMEGMKVLPLYVDHSALDAYMFYIVMAGKKILFTGDFRDHGIVGEKDRLLRTLAAFVPKNIDILITEGTMLSRIEEKEQNVVQTEEELGITAGNYFRQKKYNFVLVSSTNFDSIMEFFHNTPKQYMFICDYYQAKIMLISMKMMEEKGYFEKYRTPKNRKILYILGMRKGEEHSGKWKELSDMAENLTDKMYISAVETRQMKKDGFVMLVRKNTHPENESVFEKMRDKFCTKEDGQIIYSMWKGYLEGKHADSDMVRFIGGRDYETLHTSGHAYVDTIANVIKQVNPQIIIPMHTEMTDEFHERPEFRKYADRVKVLQDEEKLIL